MSSLLVTLLTAFVLIILCVSLLGVGLLITGKSKLRAGMCGRAPKKKQERDGQCDAEYGCHLCRKDGNEKL